MLKFKIITDSTTGLTQEEKEKYNITVLPLTLLYNGKEYRDGIDINTNDFYEMIFNENEKKGFSRLFAPKETKDFPKTSMVPPALFEEAFQNALDEGYTPVCLTITSVLSGTYQSACIARDMLDNPEDVIVVDSQTALGSVKIIIKSLFLKEYETKDEIINEIESLKSRVNYLAVMDTLEYIAKGGRISKFAAGLGNFLHFKPIMQLDYKGAITPVAKPRGIKAAYKGISDLLDKDPIDFNYPYEFGYSTDREEFLDNLIETCKDKIDGNYTVCQISPVIGAHVGPRASAIFYISTHEVNKNFDK